MSIRPPLSNHIRTVPTIGFYFSGHIGNSGTFVFTQPPQVYGEIDGIPGADPSFQMPVVWIEAAHKAHDLAFVAHPEPGKLHHLSFLLGSWEQVLRAADIMSMNRVSIDIGPTRHGITRGTTIYAFDPSGNRFETFSGGYESYPDHAPITWTFDQVGPAIFYHDRKLNERFLSVVT